MDQSETILQELLTEALDDLEEKKSPNATHPSTSSSRDEPEARQGNPFPMGFRGQWKVHAGRFNSSEAPSRHL